MDKEVLGNIMLKHFAGEGSSLPAAVYISLEGDRAGEANTGGAEVEESAETQSQSAANKPKRRTRRATAKRPLSKAIAEQDTREKNPKKPRHEYRAPPTSDTSSESGNPKLERRENPKESESVGGRVPTPPPSPRPSSAQEHAEADTQVTASGSKPVGAPKPKPVQADTGSLPCKLVWRSILSFE